MAGNGIAGANIDINDDLDAIRRARRAQCHELRVLHHIRFRGRPVFNSFDATAGVASTRRGFGIGATDSRNAGIQQMHGRAFQGNNRSSGGSGGGLTGSTRSSYSDVRNGSSAITDTGICSWSTLKDIALLYAVGAASFALYKCFTSSAIANSPSTPGEGYDFIP